MFTVSDTGDVKPVVALPAAPAVEPVKRPITLEVKDLSAGYGAGFAIRNINMPVVDREITAIIGPSGCGKSTLIRCMNRMHEVHAGASCQGDIFLDGANIFDMDPVRLRRQVGMVFQKANPFPTMSIFQNIAAGLVLNGARDRARIAQTVEESLRQAALWEEVKDKLKESALALSGGQQQRLCIARALAVSPRVLLLDEPCSALDPVATARIEELLTVLKERLTIVIVTHNMQQAARVSDNTGFMYLGELLEFDRTDKIFTNPENEKTLQYVTGRFG